jgi:Holliday junction resolvasome RuvABC endonuclease subunit
MNILSLDLSTKSSGWAIFEDTELINYGCITSASTDLIKRIYVMRDNLLEVLKNYNIDKIIVEEVRPEGTGYGVGNLKTHRALMWLQAAIAFMVHDNYKNIEIEYIYPSSWRSVCGIKNGRGIKRDSQKAADIAFVKEHYNIEVNDDIADAICIGHAQIHPKVVKELNWG